MVSYLRSFLEDLCKLFLTVAGTGIFRQSSTGMLMIQHSVQEGAVYEHSGFYYTSILFNINCSAYNSTFPYYSIGKPLFPATVVYINKKVHSVHSR
jgi:hypothetical protein